MSGLLKLWVDFNDIYDVNRVSASIRPSLRRSPSLAFEDITAGEWVELYDGEGSSCLALIDRIDWPVLHFKLDLETWRSVDTYIQPGKVTTAGRGRSELSGAKLA